MKMIPLYMLVFQMAATGVARAQTADDLSIFVRIYSISADGGEQSSVAWGTGPIVTGQSGTALFAAYDQNCEGVSASVRSETFPEGATVGWRVEVTPTRVAGRAVTFRLRWNRGLDNRAPLTPTSEDVELTLRPGEARPMDTLPIPRGWKSPGGGPCKVSAISLRVGAEYYPDEESDRRLITADVWLIERLPNGTERSQAQSLRGLPNRTIPFYFDSIPDGKVSLDILGHIVARPGEGAVEVALQTRSRWGERRATYLPTRYFKSVLLLKPDEIVEVALPKLDEKAGAFANRTFSLRIRARQVR